MGGGGFFDFVVKKEEKEENRPLPPIVNPSATRVYYKSRIVTKPGRKVKLPPLLKPIVKDPVKCVGIPYVTDKIFVEYQSVLKYK